MEEWTKKVPLDEWLKIESDLILKDMTNTTLITLLLDVVPVYKGSIKELMISRMQPGEKVEIETASYKASLKREKDISFYEYEDIERGFILTLKIRGDQDVRESY